MLVIFVLAIIIIINSINLVIILKRENQIFSSFLFLVNYILNFLWIFLLLDFKFRIIIGIFSFFLLLLETIKLRNLIKTERAEIARINGLLEAFYC